MKLNSFYFGLAQSVLLWLFRNIDSQCFPSNCILCDRRHTSRSHLNMDKDSKVLNEKAARLMETMVR